VLTAFASVSAVAQKQVPEVQSVRIVPGDSGPVVEILSTHPLTPTLQTVEGPLRLVIDVPATLSASTRKRIPFRNEQIKNIRVNQYAPTVTRIVVDLAGPVLYNWDALGNRLNIRIRTDQAATAKPASVPALTAGTQPIAVPYAEGSGGTLVEAGDRVASGTSISAKEDTAVLRLTRGGEVRVCPGTTVSVATSPGGQELMLGMSTGAMETHYRLTESSDSVLTPDFRIVLPGPGEFDFAVSADAHGNTCVSSMPGSTASVVVAELIGSGTYEVKAGEQVVFRQGKLESLETPVATCGCPARQEPVMRAALDASNVISEKKAGDKLQLENSAAHSTGSAPVTDPAMNSIAGGPETESSSQAKPGGMKVEMEPLVFSGKDRAKDRAKTQPAAPAAPVLEAVALPLARGTDPLPPVVVLPPSPKQQKGFFGHIKSFFGSIFH
jgi:hypothetical protein